MQIRKISFDVGIVVRNFYSENDIFLVRKTLFKLSIFFFLINIVHHK